MSAHTLIVTDSGFGGLSTAADLYAKLKLRSPYPNVNIIFFNAHADMSLGYQMMKTTAQKVAVFDRALHAMQDRYKPDVIYIACNTLSVIYDQTAFSRERASMVVGIVDTSVMLMREALAQYPDAAVIIFGTPTTIQMGTYPERLIRLGIPKSRMVSEACSTVHVEIQKDAGSPATRALIRKHVRQAVGRLPIGTTSVVASLNCTHYPYAEQFFSESFRECGVTVKALLNPNTCMTDDLFQGTSEMGPADLRITVVSQVEIDPPTIRQIGQLIHPTSPETAQALAEYTYDSELFDWKFAKNAGG